MLKLKTNKELNYAYIELYALPEQIAQCKAFAAEYANRNVQYYSRTRNQSNLEVIERQKYYSKIFEFMIYNYLKDCKFELCLPDLMFYNVRQKSYGADLTVYAEEGEIPIHVKSQELHSAKRNGISWLFQKTDPLVKQPEKYSERLFCGLILSEKEGHLLIDEDTKKLMTMLGEPKADYLKDGKKALYYHNINTKLEPR